jgi:lipopolysaccharide transport system ATP-binding protein
MSDTVIKVENLSKQYRLGEVGTGTISHDLNRWWARVRGKEDPFARVGETNDRTKKGNSDYVWALRDINFEVKQGEVLGIIGRNGAGKSSLLKLLSKVTSPTTGNIKMKGRVASLLEVGTGFHPELTGRENIFLNGAILGMNKAEIRSKFDEIVDFAGVERYIDTPVKRYSSGMYVRLAFAVAAHLEPEILIVDEVLAVGDAEFQKKCLGKMDEVSHKEGRTILFVSHNMASIQSLCTSTLLLTKGYIEAMGATSEILYEYNSKNNSSEIKVFKDKNVYISDFEIKNLLTGEKGAFSNQPLSIKLKIVSKLEISDADIGIGINDSIGGRIFTLFSKYNNITYAITKGTNEINCKIDNFPLKPGSYKAVIYIGTGTTILEYYDHDLMFKVFEGNKTMQYMIPSQSQGHLIIDQIWN